VFRLPPLTPYVRVMLIALLTLFVLAAVLENFLAVPMVAWLALETHQVTPLTALQLLTHVWVVRPDPQAVLWLAISCYFLWLIMAPFEARYGRRRAIELTIVAAVSSGICALLVGLVAPGLSAPLAGPQTITLCAICAYAFILPAHAEVSFFGWALAARQLLWVILGFSLIGFLTSRNASALAADLGAIGGGMAFVRYWMQRPPPRRSVKKGAAKLRVVGRDDDDSGPKRWLN
jgi:membrane associated rhomboid family serine protease